MKKILILLLILFLSACDKNDGYHSSQDLFIGEWIQTGYTIQEIGKNEGKEINEMTKCKKLNTLSVSSSSSNGGNVILKEYIKDGTDCKLYIPITTYNWIRSTSENNIYHIKGTLQHSSLEFDWTISFSNKNRTMTIIFDGVDTIYKSVYIRK